MTTEKKQEIIHFNPQVGNDDIDSWFNRLFEKLLDYTKSIIDLVENLCPEEERQLLAYKIGETDGLLLPRLVEKELEKRRIFQIKAETLPPNLSYNKPRMLQEIIQERKTETMQIDEIIEMILETRNVPQMPAITVNKSRTADGSLGPVLFSLYDGPERGFAVFFPDNGHESVGSIHTFDDQGIKRKIRSRIKVIDLDKFAEVDLYDPKKSLAHEVM
ncbi:hypothetical protein E4H04_04665 [Candidatus Bathyarchaeota archaeon]|nr:MAG: hypothetical protein E4H04_04665 [Candidatus Bathyarchaeota archaeon]